MHEHHEPIPLDNIIEILQIYIKTLDNHADENENVAKLKHVFVWSLNYLTAYKDGINSICK